MCEQNNAAVQHERERLQGYQRQNYGYGSRYDAANHASWYKQTYLPYKPVGEPGNLGYSYAFAMQGPVPLAYERGYSGDLPLDQQDKLDLPQPYTYRYR